MSLALEMTVWLDMPLWLEAAGFLSEVQWIALMDAMSVSFTVQLPGAAD